MGIEISQSDRKSLQNGQRKIKTCFTEEISFSIKVYSINKSLLRYKDMFLLIYMCISILKKYCVLLEIYLYQGLMKDVDQTVLFQRIMCQVVYNDIVQCICV